MRDGGRHRLETFDSKLGRPIETYGQLQERRWRTTPNMLFGNLGGRSALAISLMGAMLVSAFQTDTLPDRDKVNKPVPPSTCLRPAASAGAAMMRATDPRG